MAIKTIAKNRTKYIGDAFGEYTTVRHYDESTGNMAPSTVERARAALSRSAGAKLYEHRDGDGDTVTKYVVHVHSNLWFELTKPEAAPAAPERPATETDTDTEQAQYAAARRRVDPSGADSRIKAENDHENERAARAAQFTELADLAQKMTPEEMAAAGIDPGTVERFTQAANAAADNVASGTPVKADAPEGDYSPVTDWWTVSYNGRELCRVYAVDAKDVPAAVRSEVSNGNRLLRELAARGLALQWRRLRYDALTDVQRQRHDAAQRQLTPAAGRHNEDTRDFFTAQRRDLGPVQVSYVACIGCGAHGPLSTDQEHGAIADDWQEEHERQTGHSDFDLWTLQLSRVRTAGAFV